MQNNDIANFLCCSVIKKEYSNADFTQFISNITLLFETFYNRFEGFQKLRNLFVQYNNLMQVSDATQP